jgi:hypothetical protein
MRGYPTPKIALPLCRQYPRANCVKSPPNHIDRQGPDGGKL